MADNKYTSDFSDYSNNMNNIPSKEEVKEKPYYDIDSAPLVQNINSENTSQIYNPDFNPKDNIPQENDIQESNLLSDNNNAKTEKKELNCIRLIDNPPIFSTSCIMIIGICLLGELDMLNAKLNIYILIDDVISCVMAVIYVGLLCAKKNCKNIYLFSINIIICGGGAVLRTYGAFTYKIEYAFLMYFFILLGFRIALMVFWMINTYVKKK